MKTTRTALLALCISLPWAASAVMISNADFTAWQTVSIAPNMGLGANASVLAYVDNVIAASSATGFAASAGTPNTPSYFQISPVGYTPSNYIPLEQVVVSDATGSIGNPNPGPRFFNSWLGQADPGTVFGSAFANETGSRVHLPMLLVTTGGPITVNSIQRDSWSVEQNGGATPFSSSTLTTWSYGRVGVTSYGSDGVLGGGDDTYVTSGSMNASPVLAVIWTGTGWGMQMSQQYDNTPWDAGLPDDQIFNNYAAQWAQASWSGGPPAPLVWDARADYTINYVDSQSQASSATLNGEFIYVSIPEPATLGLFGMALLALRRMRLGKNAV